MTKHDEEYVTELFSLLYGNLADYANAKEEEDFKDKKVILDSNIAKTEGEILRSMKHIGVNSSTIVKIINNAFERYDYWQRITRDGSQQIIDEDMVEFFSPENVSKRHYDKGYTPYYQDALKSIDYCSEEHTNNKIHFVDDRISTISQLIDLLRVINAVSKYVPDQNFPDSKLEDGNDDFMFAFAQADGDPVYGVLVVNGNESLNDQSLNSPTAINVNNEKTNSLIEAHESLIDLYTSYDVYSDLDVIHVLLGEDYSYMFVRALINYIYYEIIGEEDELFKRQTFIFHLSEGNDLLDNFECIKEIQDHIVVDTTKNFYLFDDDGSIVNYYLGENDTAMIKITM